MTNKPNGQASGFGAPIVIDEEAIKIGGDAGGAYLDTIEKTDLSLLTSEEWRRFCTTLVFYALDAATKSGGAGDMRFARIERERVVVDEVPF